MSKLIKLSPFFISFISLVLVMGGCGSGKNAKEIKKERPAPVKVMTMKKGEVVSSLSVSGSLVPVRKARIGFKVEGKIERIYAEEGDFVKAGSPLVKLVQKNYLIAQSEAQAGLNTAKAIYTKAEVDLENSAKDYKRLDILYKKGVVTEREFDAIYTRQKTAEAEIKLAAAQVHQAEERLNMAAQNLQDTIIYAPFSGVVVQKQMEEAEVSNFISYQWTVLVLEDISSVKVECPVSENEISFMKIGKSVEIRVDAFPDKLFTGKISQINSRVDEKSRSFIIKIEIPNRDLQLKSGMFARVIIPKERKGSTLSLPSKALLIRGDENIAYTVSDGVAKLHKLTLGISDGIVTEIVDGLKEGDVVIVDGFYAVKNGTKVEIIK
jgi:RND family efflux transporter MFP subunit